MEHSFKDSFHANEYVALRAEILLCLTQADRVIYLSVAAAGGATAWLVSNVKAIPILYWAIPLFISVASHLMVRAKYSEAYKVGEYLRRIENVYADPRLGGWESNLRNISPMPTTVVAERLFDFTFIGAGIIVLLHRAFIWGH